LYTRVGKPSWLRRWVGNGNQWDALDILDKHEQHLADLYEIANEEGWSYEEKAPVVELEVAGETRRLGHMDEVRQVLELNSVDIENTSYEQNLITEDDEFGPINGLTLLYRSHGGSRYGEKEGIGATVEVEEMDLQVFDRVIENMEEHYGTLDSLPYKFMPDPGI
jgi:hypothetical protein